MCSLFLNILGHFNNFFLSEDYSRKYLFLCFPLSFSILSGVERKPLCYCLKIIVIYFYEVVVLHIPSDLFC